ncbi:YceI family protein [Inhella gelatinilytica]|uniref:Polyisoprenoid-binding protein n=1 Tax=Inhella gelatinilytica TaxID=2795030 RepID=A0A931NEV0_9BURK|nr:YceI family protein [Inhella gelatinilytica]MBH9553595.1 polyisoprenoid-binding protein [Inhella gelatinilytica]
MKRIALLSLACAAGLAHAEPATYKLDPTHSFVTFEVRHFGTSTNRGRFDKKEGQITVDTAAKTGRAEITIDMTSISTGTPNFDRHLKSKDFFDAEQHATARFVGTQFEFDGDKIKSVSGELTMLGKTAPVKLTATHYNCYAHPMLKVQACGGDFEATIQRSAWGMGYGAAFIPDAVKLVIQVEGLKQP